MLPVVIFTFAMSLGRNFAAAEGAPKPTTPGAAPSESTPATAQAPPTMTPLSRTDAGKKAAEELAARLKAKGVACDGWEEGPFGYFDPRIQSQTSIPQAVMSCTGTNEEDITFYIFASADDAGRYISVKRQYLCRQTAKNSMWFYPGFPYVTKGNWVIEPDEMVTAKQIATILGGEAAMANCKGIWPTPVRKTPTP